MGAPADATAPAAAANWEKEVGCSNEDRFVIELEFVQCLANPSYLNWLARNKYFEEASFINYLQYLQYFKQPAYAKYLTYPHCLFFLDLVQQAEFRTAIANHQYAEHIRQQQDNFFLRFMGNRVAEAVTTAPEDNAV